MPKKKKISTSNNDSYNMISHDQLNAEFFYLEERRQGNNAVCQISLLAEEYLLKCYVVHGE